MAIDENDFFRQATLRICSSLDMETAMQRSLQYLSEVMPVDHLILTLYDRGLGAVRTVFTVSLHTGRQEEYPLIPLSVEARKMLEKPSSLNTLFRGPRDLDSVM